MSKKERHVVNFGVAVSCSIRPKINAIFADVARFKNTALSILNPRFQALRADTEFRQANRLYRRYKKASEELNELKKSRRTKVIAEKIKNKQVEIERFKALSEQHHASARKQHNVPNSKQDSAVFSWMKNEPALSCYQYGVESQALRSALIEVLSALQNWLLRITSSPPSQVRSYTPDNRENGVNVIYGRNYGPGRSHRPGINGRRSQSVVLRIFDWSSI